MITVYVECDLEVYCSSCGKKLGASFRSAQMGKRWIDVDPCDSCLEDASFNEPIK
jgi:hypothetical protein